jgi:hypothetical protein
LATRIPARLTAAEGRRFGLLVGGAFVLVGVVLWRRDHSMAAGVAAFAGSLLAGGGLLVPARLGPLYRAWMRLALAISTVTTPVFMSLVFFLVLTPMGLVARLVGHRPLAVRPRAGSYWRSRSDGGQRGTMDHQF